MQRKETKGASLFFALVQHTGFAFGGKPGFKQAVEVFSVTPAQAVQIAKLGGLTFKGYADASDAAEAANYPPEVTGLYPRAKGTFRKVRGVDSPAFIPEVAA